MARTGDLNVGVLLLDGFLLSSLAMLHDTLAIANSKGGGNITVELMTPTGQPAMAAFDVELPVSNALIWPEDFQYVVVLGLLSGRLWRWSGAVNRYLRTVDRVGSTLVGLETGVETLARFGFLDRSKAVVAQQDSARLAETYPATAFSTQALLAVFAGRVTSLGGVAASDLAAWLIARHMTAATARQAAAALNREGVRAPDTAPPFSNTYTRYADARLRKVISEMSRYIDRPITIEELARRAGISRRHLERIFISETGTSAAKTYLSIRLNEAARILRQSRHTIAKVAYATGFADGAHLTRTFKRVHGVSPSHYRRSSAGSP